MILLIFKHYLYHSQTIHADCGCNKSCEDQLAVLRKEAATFFSKFDEAYDIAHQHLEAIQMPASFLQYALDSFVRVNYGVDFDLDSLNCVLRQALDVFNEQLNQTKPHINDLRTDCDTLVNMADNFSRKHNLICKRGTFRGCEADLNNLRCDLSAFIKDLKKYAREARADFRGLDRACFYLGNTAKKLDSDYHPTCVANGNNNQANLKGNIKGIYTEFRKRFDVGMESLKDIVDTCKGVNVAIDNWNARLA